MLIIDRLTESRRQIGLTMGIQTLAAAILGSSLYHGDSGVGK